MRILGIDYGLRRTGIAIAERSATSAGMALPFEVFEGLTDESLALSIAQLVRTESVDKVIIGLPLHANGAPSGQSNITERFVAALQKAVPIPVIRATEYLSTHDSEWKLAGHFTRKQKRARVDAIAAARILQDWLDQNPDPAAAKPARGEAQTPLSDDGQE